MAMLFYAILCYAMLCLHGSTSFTRLPQMLISLDEISSSPAIMRSKADSDLACATFVNIMPSKYAASISANDFMIYFPEIFAPAGNEAMQAQIIQLFKN